MDKQHRLFDLFNRLGDDDKGVDGTGIELSISNHFMKMMCRELVFESAEGMGITFFVRLPLNN
jgi:signal transduction histidine kinase